MKVWCFIHISGSNKDGGSIKQPPHVSSSDNQAVCGCAIFLACFVIDRWASIGVTATCNKNLPTQTINTKYFID